MQRHRQPTKLGSAILFDRPSYVTAASLIDLHVAFLCSGEPVQELDSLPHRIGTWPDKTTGTPPYVALPDVFVVLARSGLASPEQEPELCGAVPESAWTDGVVVFADGCPDTAEPPSSP